MISEHLLGYMSEVRQLLQEKGFKIQNPDDTHEGSPKTNGIPDILVYGYVNGKHHIDICVHQNLKNRLAYASYVHYWGSSVNEHKWGDGLSTIIWKLKTDQLEVQFG